MHPRLVRVYPVRAASAAGVILATAVALGAVAPNPADGQVITPKTVPVFQNQQFDILPSVTAGMAGVSIAVDDSLSDPFVNPAKTARVRGGSFFSSPFRHSISGDRGGGRTMPFGGMGSIGDWAFAGAVALQQIDRAGPMAFSSAISDHTATNQYLWLSAARTLGAGVSLGVSGSFATLDAVDGVDLLYPGSDRIRQSSGSSDLRIGLTKSFDGQKTLEAMLLHGQFDGTHDVHFGGQVWDQGIGSWVPINRDEHNENRTRIWGAHAEYSQPIGTEGWRIGWLATVNRLSHPKIPNYVLQSIPRDPGSTEALNAGVGLSREFGRSKFGLDFIVEPMRSSTWAEAARDTATVGGGTIKAGAKTVENSFNFANTLMRVGFGHDIPMAKDSVSVFGFQLGVAVHSINYRLGQTNNVTQTFREQKENWMEWTPTLGLSFRTGALQLRYNYTASCASSDCITIGREVVAVATPNSGDVGSGGIIAAPGSALSFQGGSVTSHKLSVVIPIR